MNLKMITRARCVFVLLFGLSTIGYAQDFNPDYVEYHAKTLPETPNAANFTLYGDIPVSHATGVPQINIPLFTIVEDGVSVPISLSYHASGVKVDELASSVGLKWTLNAGGGVYRQVNDDPDESGWLDPNSRGFVTPTWIDNQPGGGLLDQAIQDQIAVLDNMDDFYPDSFNYSFNGHSGNFIFDLNGNVAMEEDTSLSLVKIQGVGQLIDFRAFDGVGNTYYFDDDKEFNTQNVVVGSTVGNGANFNSSAYTSGWMLDRIVTKNNKTISFSYDSYSLSYTINDVSHSLGLTNKCIVNSESVRACGCLGEGTGPITNLTTTSIIYSPQNKLPSVIESPTVQVTFNYADDANLSTWKRKLTSIDILDKLGNKTKSFVFTYGQFPGDPRLRLDQVQEIGFDGTSKPPYKFYYEGGTLPSKGDKGKDNFGYYNGKNNGTLVPYTVTAATQLNNTYTNMLADRSPNEITIDNGILTKIEYPTGGSTEFDYEPNLVVSTTTNSPSFSSKFAGVSTQNYASSFEEGAFTKFHSSFTIDNDVIPGQGTTVFYSGSSDICAYDPQNPNFDCSKFNIYPATGSLITGPPVFTPNDLVVWADGSDIIPAGDYIIEMIVETSDLNANPNALIKVDLNWMDLNDPIFYAGGLRVKSVTDRNTDNSIAKTTQYTYEDLVGDSKNYSHFVKGFGERTVFSSNDQQLNQFEIKAGHFYKKVTIDVVDGTDTLRTIEYFDDKLKNTFHDFQMVRQENYRGSKMVRSVQMEYQNTINTTQQFWVLGDADLCYIVHDPYQTVTLLGYNSPISLSYSHFRHLLQERTEVAYDYEDPDPFNAVVTIEKYQYNNGMLMTSQELDGRYFAQSQADVDNQTLSFDANGEWKTVEYTYPENHTIEEPVMVTLNNGANFALPVSKTVKDHSDLVQGQFMEYDTDGNVVATYRYSKGAGTNTSSSGHIPADYELYEEYTLDTGRPVEIRRADGPPTTMVWDNTDTYVLASIQNATLADVNTALGPVIFTDVENGLTTAQENALRGLANTFVTTYTYNPLIGVTTVTDPREYTMQYEYDGLGRLKAVKDSNGDYVSENFYHYKGQ